MEPLRVLVVSPLGAFIGPLLSNEFACVDVVRTRTELDSVLHRGGPLPDVALVDVLWSSTEFEWTYDGLDALGQLDRAGREVPTIMAGTGLSVETDYLDEALTHRLYRGLIIKGKGLRSVADAARLVGLGGRVPNAEEQASRRATVCDFLCRNPLAAHIVGAIASASVSSWQEVATETRKYKERTVRDALGLFEDLFAELGDPAAGHVTQAAVFRWCGEHAGYLVSHCRRHGLPQYARRRSSAADGAAS